MWHLCTDFIPRDFKNQSWSERRLYGEQNTNICHSSQALSAFLYVLLSIRLHTQTMPPNGNDSV